MRETRLAIVLSEGVRRYFVGTKSYSTSRLIVELALLPFPFKLVFGYAWGAILAAYLSSSQVPYVPSTGYTGQGQPLGLFWFTVLSAPWAETLIHQCLLIWLLSLLRATVLVMVTISASLFAVVHYPYGVTQVLAAFPLGIVLAWSFLMLRDRSFWKGYWVTSVIHLLHNLLSLSLGVVLR